MTLYTATITLFLVMDPLGNVPMFLAALNNVNPLRHRRIILRETFIAFLILLFFLFFGKYILEYMQISESALSIAGGILLFLIAIRMIFPHQDGGQDSNRRHEEPFIVPLAIPMIAGPSTMTVVMLLATTAPQHMWLWTMSLFLAWVFCTVILVFAAFLRKIFGERGLTAIERLMGMILTTMAIQMFLTGVQQFFHL